MTEQHGCTNNGTRELSVSTVGDISVKLDRKSSFTVKSKSENGTYSVPSSSSDHPRPTLCEKNHDLTGQQWPVLHRSQTPSPVVGPPSPHHQQLKWADCDTLDMLPKAMSFTWFDIVLDLFSIFCYILDVVSDVVTAYVHYYTKNWTFFHLTVFFIAVPSFITTMISLRWSVPRQAPDLDDKHFLKTFFILFAGTLWMQRMDRRPFPSLEHAGPCESHFLPFKWVRLCATLIRCTLVSST